MWVTEFWAKTSPNVKGFLFYVTLLYSEYIKYVCVHSCEPRVVTYCVTQQKLIQYSAAVKMIYEVNDK